MVRKLIVASRMESPSERDFFVDFIHDESQTNTLRVCLLARERDPDLEQRLAPHAEVVAIDRRGLLDVSTWSRMHGWVTSGLTDEICLWDAPRQLDSWLLAVGSARPIQARYAKWDGHDDRSWQMWVASAFRRFHHSQWESQSFADLVSVTEQFLIRDSKHISGLDSKPQLLEKLGIPTGSRLVGTAAELRVGAGLKDAIWAIDLLQNVRDDVHLLVAGTGRQEWRLRRFAEQTKTSHRVHWLGHLPCEAWIGALNQYWSTNIRPVHPYAALMAMRAGVPVIATDSQQHRLLIEHDCSGILYPGGSRRDLARQSYRLLKSSQLETELGLAGKAQVESRVLVNKMNAPSPSESSIRVA